MSSITEMFEKKCRCPHCKQDTLQLLSLRYVLTDKGVRSEYEWYCPKCESEYVNRPGKDIDTCQKSLDMFGGSE